MRLIRGEDGRLFQAGIADSQPIPLKKQLTMIGVSTRRKTLTTAAEKKLCFALQCFTWITCKVAPYQREKIIHVADILSRSLDFYFSQGKLGIEVDGASHRTETQRAKDEWTDRLLLEHSGILVLRFRNETVLSDVNLVIASIATYLRDRHGWPRTIKQRFDDVIGHAASAESWRAITTKFLDYRSSR